MPRKELDPVGGVPLFTPGEESTKAREIPEVRFLHTADWQLGHWPTRLPEEKARQLYEARFDTVRRIAQVAHEHRVHFVLVAGDVFHHEAVGRDTLNRALAALETFAPIPVYLIPGNHDPMSARLYQSRWFRDATPGHVHVSLAPEVRRVGPDGRVALATVPVRQRGETWPPLDRVPSFPPDARFRVAMVHGNLREIAPPEASLELPISLTEARDLGLHYLALGHWHSWRQAERAVYPGTPEPTSFEEPGAGFVALVTLRTPEAPPEIQQVPVGQFSWHTWTLQAETTEDALHQLDTRIQETPLNDHTLLQVHLEIREHLPPLAPRLDTLKTRLQQRVFHLDWHLRVLRRRLPQDFEERVARQMPNAYELFQDLRARLAPQEEPSEEPPGSPIPRVSLPEGLPLAPPTPEQVVHEALRELEQLLLDLLEEPR